MLKKIVITGPESTGKSSLANALAQCYHGRVVKEYAREYIDRLDRHYEEEDLLKIAQIQLQREDEEAREKEGLLFCDTDLTVLEIWSMEKYGRIHPWIKNQLLKRAYHLYLVCDIDLAWVPDPQRENPNDRAYLLNLYKESLERRNIQYFMINGKGEERVKQAIRIIETQLGTYLLQEDQS